MLRNEKELSKITDEEFNKIIKPFDKKVDEHISNNIINQFVAFYIATGYKYNAIWNGKFILTVEQATNELAQYTSDNCDVKKIKSILEKEYGLKVVNDSPTEIVEINKKKK